MPVAAAGSACDDGETCAAAAPALPGTSAFSIDIALTLLQRSVQYEKLRRCTPAGTSVGCTCSERTDFALGGPLAAVLNRICIYR